jgi:hypothetical protein
MQKRRARDSKKFVDGEIPCDKRPHFLALESSALRKRLASLNNSKIRAQIAQNGTDVRAPAKKLRHHLEFIKA